MSYPYELQEEEEEETWSNDALQSLRELYHTLIQSSKYELIILIMLLILMIKYAHFLNDAWMRSFKHTFTHTRLRCIHTEINFYLKKKNYFASRPICTLILVIERIQFSYHFFSFAAAICASLSFLFVFARAFISLSLSLSFYIHLYYDRKRASI